MNYHPPAEIFKAYDIRGIVDETLTTSGVYKIGRAIGFSMKESQPESVVICVGRDGRISGSKLASALIDGLNSVGDITVINVGMVTTPILYYGAISKSDGNGVMVTGSHNPPNYNGLKLMIGGHALSGEEIQDIYKRTKNQTTIKKIEILPEQLDLNSSYQSEIIRSIKLHRRIKVAIDCGNGIAGDFAPAIFTALGCDVEKLYCDVDGNFPNHHPDPSDPRNLIDLVNWLKNSDAELGLAFDGDGDRLGVVTKSGEIIFPDRQLMLFAEDVLSRKPGAEIIFDVKCSSLLAKWIVDHGGCPVMHKTGHSLIKKKMRETQAPLAGEMSGHIFFKERWFGFDDGIYAGARLLEILSRHEDVTEVLNQLPNAVNTPELQISLPEGENHAFVENLAKTKKLSGAKSLITIDGIRAEYEFGFGLIRASNTTPVLVLRFEANNTENLSLIKSDFRAAILEINPKLKIPF